MKSSPRLAVLALALSATLASFAAQAESAKTSLPAPAPLAALDSAFTQAYAAAQLKWKRELSAFSQADLERTPSEGGVLFVGSSTIRMWSSLAEDFRSMPVVINRGFGGSTMNDCNLFAKDLVVRYKPRQVLVYAGDNDLAEGRTPMQVLESFAHFTSTLRAELPGVRIAYISIKPSPSRAALLPQIRETNDMIAAYMRRLPQSEYIDIHTAMLGADGQPRPELFRADHLHLNAEGYALWKSIIASHLPAADASAGTRSATAQPAIAVPTAVPAAVRTTQAAQAAR